MRLPTSPCALHPHPAPCRPLPVPQAWIMVQIAQHNTNQLQLHNISALYMLALMLLRNGSVWMVRSADKRGGWLRCCCRWLHC